MTASNSQRRINTILNHLSPQPDICDGCGLVVNGTASVSSELMTEILAHRKLAEGQTLGVTKWLQLTQEELHIFSSLTHDHNWIHKAGAGKKGSPFGAPIAHGLLSLSFLPKFYYEIMGKHVDQYAKYIKTGINYGYDKVRFVGPVMVGNSIRARIVLKDVSLSKKPKTIKDICTITIETKDELSGKISNAVIIESISLTVYR